MVISDLQRRHTRATHGIAIGLAILLVLPALAGLLGVRAEAIENRPLAPWPNLSPGTLLSRDDVPAINAALVDRLPLRRHIVGLQSRIGLGVWHDSPNEAVALGEPPWLFLGETFFNACSSAAQPKPVADQLARLSRILEDSGRRLLIGIVPDKAAVYPERLGRSSRLTRCADFKRGQLRRALRSAAIPGYVDLWSALDAVKQRTPEPPLYIPNDTHWSPFGALQSTRMLIRALDPGLWNRADVVRGATIEHEGDLTRMIGLPSRLSVVDYAVERGVTLKPMPQTHPGLRDARRFRTHTRANANAPLAARMLLIHDSFGEALLHQLPRFFTQTHAAHWKTTARSLALVGELREAEIVVLVVAERDVYTWVPRTFSDAAILDALPGLLARAPR